MTTPTTEQFSAAVELMRRFVPLTPVTPNFQMVDWYASHRSPYRSAVIGLEGASNQIVLELAQLGALAVAVDGYLTMHNSGGKSWLSVSLSRELQPEEIRNPEGATSIPVAL